MAAYKCFEFFPGIWEIMVMPRNTGAYQFWRTIINKYTAGSFTEYTRQVIHLENGTKDIFKFRTRG
jgi:predicted acetyltransferase